MKMPRLMALLAPCLALASSAWAQAKPVETVTIGYVGQALGQVSIYIAPRTNSRALASAKHFDYLTVRPMESNQEWVEVALVAANRRPWLRVGYAKAEQVAMLPYEVTLPKAAFSGQMAGNPSLATISASASGAVQDMLAFGHKFIGTPYRWGGNSLTRGIDCSAFVQQIFKRIGVSLPRTAAEQARVGQKISDVRQLRPGDRLYFWDKKRGKIGHTGVFMGFFEGKGWFIHSSTNNRGVDIDDILAANWQRIYTHAMR
jgi:cell wall-associated NlpC family hydrolase